MPLEERLHNHRNAGAAELSKLKYLVDRYHVRGHAREECDISKSSCNYHPEPITFTEINTANTECVEKTFSGLKKYKHTVKYMTMARLVLHSIIEEGYREIHERQQEEFP